MKVLQESVTHDVKVTHLKGHGYGIRVMVNGQINQEGIAPTRADIGPVAREMLRMEDKCGNISDYASSARHRAGVKENRHRLAESKEHDVGG